MMTEVTGKLAFTSQWKRTQLYMNFAHAMYSLFQMGNSKAYPPYINWLGPSQSQRSRTWFEPKENTKMGVHTHHHHPPPPPTTTQTFLPLPGYIGILMLI